MRIRKFLESSNQDLKYYAFDIDDNLFHMPTVIHLEKKQEDGSWEKIDVSTSEFAKVRNDKDNYRLLNNNPVDAFSEFKDDGPRGESAFLEDMKKAISSNEFGPSWDAFIECLREGNIFALITARGHRSITFRKSVEYLMDHVLSKDESYEMYNNCLKHSYFFGERTDYDRVPRGPISKTPLIKEYLDACYFHGVSGEDFTNEFGEASASNPEKAKELALDKFIEKCNEYGIKVNAKSVSVGFSDDDAKNVDHVDKYFKEKSALSNNLPHKLKLNLYKTTDRTIKGGERKVFNESSSIVPFSKFTSQQSRYFPSSKENDPAKNIHNLELNHLMDISQSIKPSTIKRNLNKRRKKSS